MKFFQDGEYIVVSKFVDEPMSLGKDRCPIEQRSSPTRAALRKPAHVRTTIGHVSNKSARNHEGFDRGTLPVASPRTAYFASDRAAGFHEMFVVRLSALIASTRLAYFTQVLQLHVSSAVFVAGTRARGAWLSIGEDAPEASLSVLCS